MEEEETPVEAKELGAFFTTIGALVEVYGEKKVRWILQRLGRLDDADWSEVLRILE